MAVPGSKLIGERGVSPVVATVVVVAVVVILASVIGVYTSDIVEKATQEPAPQASFSFLQNGNAVTVTHDAGDSIPADEVVVSAGGTEQKWSAVSSGSTISAGRTAQLTVSGKTDVQVIWRPDSSDRSAVLAERKITAPANPSYSGTNAKIKSTDEDGSYLGFGNRRLNNAGYSSEGHLRIAPYKSSGSQLQVRNTDDDVIEKTAYSPARGTHSFTLTYDGSTLKLTAGGQSVETSAFSVAEDAITIQVKKADRAVTTAKVSKLKVDGASVGTPDEISVSAVDEKSLLLEGGGFTDGFTLEGEFTFDDSGSVSSGEGFVLRFDVA
jgi:flagellin-like protein